MARARGVNPRRDGCDRRPSLPRRDGPLKRCVEYEEGVEATLPSDHLTSCPGAPAHWKPCAPTSTSVLERFAVSFPIQQY